MKKRWFASITRRWFQSIFIVELRINFGTERQIKLKLILGLLIVANWFPCLDTGHQDILFHACVKFWIMSNHWGSYEILFITSLEKFYEVICTVRYQTQMSVCLGLWIFLSKSLHPLPDLVFSTALSRWIGTRFPCRVG